MKDHASLLTRLPLGLAHADPEVRLGMLGLRAGLLALAVAAGVCEYGFYDPVAPRWALRLVEFGLMAVYAAHVVVNTLRRRYPLLDHPPRWPDWLLLGVTLFGAAAEVLREFRGAWHVFEAAVVILFSVEVWRLNVGLSRRLYRPGLMLPLSFLALIAAGTLLIKLPKALPPGVNLSWLDALFTMTSAACVTGLTVRDTSRFTPLGMTILGVVIQLGGLGIILFGATLASLVGRSMSLRENLSLSAMLSNQPLHRLTGLAWFVLATTVLVELAGAAVMFPMWTGPAPDGGPMTVHWRLGLSLFTAVSAYCNAGFSLMPDSLASYRFSALSHAVVLPLIVLGGLGFPVLDDLWQALVHRVRTRRLIVIGPPRADAPRDLNAGRLNLHTRVVLATTAALYLYGTLGLAVGQLKPHADQALKQGQTSNQAALPPLDAGRLGAVLADASFMSVSARTAGFNTLPMDDISPAGRFVLLTLMFAGGSPGGTAGGVKTTVVALLILTVVATVRQRPETEAFERTLADSIVRKAATVAACLAAVVCAATLLLSLSEPYPFSKVFFEAVSAATTTGLSLGITPDLTSFGKAVLIAAMFLGRVGPLVLLGGVLFATRPRRPYEYPHEDVLMG